MPDDRTRGLAMRGQELAERLNALIWKSRDLCLEAARICARSGTSAIN